MVIKNIVGIDYSMNNIGICVYRNKKHEFYSVSNTYSFSSSKKESFHKNFRENCNNDIKDIISSLDCVSFFSRKPNSLKKGIKDKKEKNHELNRWHRETFVWSNVLSEAVIDVLDSLDLLNNETVFVIENYLTNRNGGDTTIQIVEFTKSFKDKLFYKVSYKNVFIVTAPEIKMLAGSGNYTKQEMFMSFLNENIDSKFRKFCLKNQNILKVGKKDVKKPIDDVIDGYYLVKWYRTNNLF